MRTSKTETAMLASAQTSQSRPAVSCAPQLAHVPAAKLAPLHLPFQLGVAPFVCANIKLQHCTLLCKRAVAFQSRMRFLYCRFANKVYACVAQCHWLPCRCWIRPLPIALEIKIGEIELFV